MTGARTSFTCSTSTDLDIIDWLDSFGSRERGFAIKAAIRAYMVGESPQSSPPEIGLSNLDSLGEQVSELYRVIIAVQKQNEKLLALSLNSGTIDINNDLSEGASPEAMKNISNLLKDD